MAWRAISHRCDRYRLSARARARVRTNASWRGSRRSSYAQDQAHERAANAQSRSAARQGSGRCDQAPMISLDTNVLARYLLKDDLTQHRAAMNLLASSSKFTAPSTVMLELVWVLESAGARRPDIARALHLLFGLPNFRPHEHEALTYALGCYETGMDFADALHLALSTSDVEFKTFDKKLVKQATALVPAPVVSLL